MRNDHKTNLKHTDAKASIKSPPPIVEAAITAKTPSTKSKSNKKIGNSNGNGNNGDIITIITSNNISGINSDQQYNNSPILAQSPTANADATRITIVENCPQTLKAKSRTSSRLVRFLKSTKQRKREEKQQLQQQQFQQQVLHPHQSVATALNGHTNENVSRSNSQGTTTTTTTTTSGESGSSSGGSSWQYCDVTHCVSFQDNIADVHHRKGRRLNGLQLPLHPLQLFGWLVLVLFGVAAYWLLIPSFAPEWQGPLYGLITGLYIVHVVSHIAALLLDPADRELRRLHRNDRIVPEFDRSKHAHVIENGRCHLCNIRTTSQRTKHCSVCNKCVGKFDHHCKWLNHCVGSRNYVAFLMCVVSAVIATLVIVAAVLAQFAFYYLQPHWLRQTAGTTAPLLGDVGVMGGGGNSDFETIAFVLSENASSSPNNSSDLDSSLSETMLNLTGILLEPGIEDIINNITLPVSPTSLTNATMATIPLESSVSSSSVNESLSANFSQSITAPTAPTANDGSDSMQDEKPPIAVIAGIGLSDTIFLVLLGFLGLLAAITAGLLLHLCFFHIYISFLGLTTYEYIRNHRQAQEAKAKLNVSNLTGQQATIATGGTLMSTGSPLTAPSTPPSKHSSSGCAQIYCCSSLRHPNAMNTSGYGKQAPKLSNRGGLHCCADYREYHQTALKTYYMCSLLEERGKGCGTDVGPLGGISHISGGASVDDDDDDVEADLAHLRTFHCCSSFAASTTQRKPSTATTKATLVNDLEAALSARRSYLQYTEQCTFCTFRIRSPSLGAKRGKSGGIGGSTSSCSSATSTRSISRTQSGELNIASRTTSAASTKILSSGGGGAGGGGGEMGGGSTGETHPRCCMKAISKQQRWRRKWNCCSSVPDSPDVPNDIIATLAMRQQQQTQQQQQQHQHFKSTNATEIPVHFIRSVNDNGDGGDVDGDCPSPPLPSTAAATKLNATLSASSRATRNSRTWPVGRFRHMMRMFNRYRRPRCRHHHHHQQQQQQQQNIDTLMAEQVKQNQIRPLQLHSANGCHQQQHYDSSSPLPSSTTATLTPSSERSVTTPSSSLGGGAGVQPIETILPTSVIRDDSAITYTMGIAPAMPAVTISLPPALPPPTRRKIPNPTDLEELAETLAFAASHNPNGGGGGGNNGGSGGGGGSSSANRLPALQNVYRRQRRKHFLRTRSPTLSPIHESGLSNPTSPQPGRHHTSANTSASISAASAGCSPVANAAAVVNNLCGSNSELTRKTASNSSLSSNSSSSN